MKYIILDFGKVIAGPTTGDWFITPSFIKNVDMSLIDKDKFAEAIKKYGYLKDGIIKTLEEEYDAFYELYKLSLKDIGYKDYEVAKDIAYNFVYENDKYKFYKNVAKQIRKLRENYTVILLTDNWPCVIRILKEKNMINLFDKIYVSSIYGYQKKDGYLFDDVINDYNINKNEAIFIDDNEELLDIAYSKGLDVRLMDRNNEIEKSKYKIIHNLNNVI